MVQATGVVRSREDKREGRRLEIAATLAEGDRSLGASVCVSGVCLTVTAASAEHFAVDVAFETLDKTTLGALEVGAPVNLEPSLRLGDALGGHLVSGHVDGVGHLRGVRARGDARECWFWVPPELRRYVAVKGSICIDGVSLTVNTVDEQGFMVGLIPHTLEVTTLGGLIESIGSAPEPDLGSGGPACNLEVDMLARYVERLLGARELPGGTLNQAGAQS
nr:riboflavin synthase [Pseudenhygromyxa sp. WMMC2535]